ncbi:MAG: cytochrome c [Acidobacteria bacterium]|nr:cytochrome c [Acidobacteriota bacterium]
MGNMRLIAALGCSAGLLLAQDKAALIERGKYLAEQVGKCQECHTPRKETRELDTSQWMKGATLDFQPIGAEPPGWHKKSPDLTPTSRLWTRWGDDGMKKYLTTGLTPTSNKPAGPPMPAYTLRPEDADAIIAYLKSLK